MIEYLNKQVIIVVKPSENLLTYQATIKEITDTHITFEDKFNSILTFRIQDIIEIKLENKGDNQND